MSNNIYVQSGFDRDPNFQSDLDDMQRNHDRRMKEFDQRFNEAKDDWNSRGTGFSSGVDDDDIGGVIAWGSIVVMVLIVVIPLCCCCGIGFLCYKFFTRKSNQQQQAGTIHRPDAVPLTASNQATNVQSSSYPTPGFQQIPTSNLQPYPPVQPGSSSYYPSQPSNMQQPLYPPAPPSYTMNPTGPDSYAPPEPSKSYHTNVEYGEQPPAYNPKIQPY